MKTRGFAHRIDIEASPPRVWTALCGPIFAASLMKASEGGERGIAHYQATFTPLLYGVALAIVLTLILRETGPAARSQVKPTEKPEAAAI